MRLCLCLVSLALACDKGSPSPAAGASAETISAIATTSASSPPTAPALSNAAATATAAIGSVETSPPETIIAQHVLVTYRGAKRAPKSVTRTKIEAKARAQEVVSKVRAGTAFEDVVKTYSDDQGSVDRMGSLGKFHKGDMDPAFSTAAFALKLGEVSDVVETPFGFHIIKRTQ
jgi:NIMA-interacting peptidyl-prolyl cis-trans isomerase 1